jgi:CheY-like chemotaxis protein
MAVEQLLVALGFTLFGVIVAVAITLLVMDRRLRRRTASAAAVTASASQRETKSTADPVAEEPQASGASTAVARQSVEDPIVIHDAVDADLFPVFEEEATGLLTRFGADLRFWAKHPDDTAPRASMLRALQMLKGSARVAGAMQLGEHAQRMEVAIEALGRGALEPAGLQQLRARFDTLQASFDRLRAAGSSVVEAPGTTQRMPQPAAPELPPAGGRTAEVAAAATPVTLVLPLAPVLARVRMLRVGESAIAVASDLIDEVQQVDAAVLAQAYRRHVHAFRGEDIPFYWAGALLQGPARHRRGPGERTGNSVVIVRSALQRVALHVDEVRGDHDVVVGNLGPPLSRLSGMDGMSVLASGAVALICNPVPATTVPGEPARALQHASAAAPVVDATAPAGSATRAAASSPATAHAVPVPLILVVDDSITVRLVAQRLLLREGYRVALAVDGLQALSRLQEERPAVVLSDIEMPGMDGFDLARNIRADGALAGLPIIMITSRIAEKHRQYARQLGVNHYLGKPYAEEELIKLVRLYTGAALLATA